MIAHKLIIASMSGIQIQVRLQHCAGWESDTQISVSYYHSLLLDKK